MVIKGDQASCNYEDSVTLRGAATAARTDITIKEHRGIIGEVITVPINLENSSNFANSNTNSVSTTVQYDYTLLAPRELNLMKGQAVISAQGILDIKNIPVKNTDADQPAIDNIKFRVLPGSPNTSCPLTVTGTVADGTGQASFTEVSGKFTLDIVSADIKIGNVSAYPGEKIDIPVTITNFRNYKPGVNKTLNIDVRFNKTILECADGSVSCVVSSDNRIATIPVPLAGLSGTDLPVVNKKFRTMLGLVETSPLEIAGVSLENGQITTVNTDGRIDLKICTQGGNRLFDASKPGAAVYTPEPNPVNSNSEIRYQTAERGYTKVFISDVIGNTVSVLVDGYIAPGAYSVMLDSSGLPNGVYIITIQTETQTDSKIFSIVN